MRGFLKRMVGALMAVGLLISVTGSWIDFSKAEGMNVEQKNAIAMLNHLTVLTQETNASKNSRLFMEQAYSSLINNTYPNSVDNRTLNQMIGLLDTMERYRMINVKRDRLQFIYEQNQAQAIRAAMPNPIGLLSSVHSLTPARLIASIVFMAADSYTSYTQYTAETELQAVKDGWALDDEEEQVLHDSSKSTFSYMVKMVNDYNIPGELALTESTVEDFVNWKNEPNVVARIQLLESNREIYESYGGYWLTLANSYYDNNEFQNCLDAITAYEEMGTRLFRWDYEYAKTLPLGIAAAAEVYPDRKYKEYANTRANAIFENTRTSDWALRYFVAQTYIDLAGRTGDKDYLQKAYDVVVENVTYLVKEQQIKNATFLTAVKETLTPKDATKSQKEEIKKYNNALKEERKTEFAPISEPLALNCDLLFAVAKELDIPDSEKTRIDTILHPNGSRLFLMEVIDDQYWFNSQENFQGEVPFEYNGTGLVLPVSLLTKDAKIVVTVKEKNSEETVTIGDWKLDEIKRGTEGDISTFIALYSSKEARQHAWKPEETIEIDITPMKDNEMKTYHFDYITEGTKKEWYDYLKFWEGHKNQWYDYLKVWDNSVNFIRVK